MYQQFLRNIRASPSRVRATAAVDGGQTRVVQQAAVQI
jgi:hypothetical protein